MSFTHTFAMGFADDFLRDIEEKCLRTMIVGSLRRKKPEVKDIEILVIPDVGERQVITDLFGEVVNEQWTGGLEDHLSKLQKNTTWTWELDQVVKRNGPRYKRFIHKITHIPVDLFITSEYRWAYQEVIRTGPAKFSQMIVTRALQNGMCFKDSFLHNHPKNQSCEDIPCTNVFVLENEQDLFDALKLEWIDPKERK